MTEQQSGQAAQKTSASGASGKSTGGARTPRWPAMVAALAVVVALGSAALSAYLFEQGRRAQADRAALEQRLAGLEAEVAAQDERIMSRGEIDSALSDMRDGIDAVSERLQQTRSRIGELREMAEGGRAGWLRAEVEYLLRAASETLQLRRDVTGALTALDLADRRLQRLDAPGLIPVREAIAEAEQKLRALPEPDRAGRALTLASLSRQVSDWPMPAPAPGAGAAQTAAEDEASTAREAESFTDALLRVARELVIVRRHEEQSRPMLSQREQALARLGAALRLDAARLALLRGEDELFRAELDGARAWVRRHFDTSDSAVTAALERLGELREPTVRRGLPDISTPLEVLRSSAREQGGAQAGKSGQNGDESGNDNGNGGGEGGSP